MKACSRCKTVKPVDDFSKNKGAKDGLQSQCKECKAEWYKSNKGAVNEKNRQWHASNRARANDASRQWREANPDYHRQRYELSKESERERGRQWREANPDYHQQYRRANQERRAEYGRQYRADNKERIAEYDRNWQQINPDKVRDSNHRRRAAKANAILPGMSQPNLDLLVRFYGKACLYPGCDNSVATLDHVVPLSKGGKHTYANTQPLCNSHNSSKGNWHSTDYRPSANIGNGKEGTVLTNITRIQQNPQIH